MPARELVGVSVSGLVLVEGLPGSGKSTTASGLVRWLADQQVAVEHYAEGRVDHPVDLEQVAVLSTEQVLALASESPDTSRALLSAAEHHGDAWLVRHALHPSLPHALVERLRAHDASGGSVTHEVHSRVLTDSWRRFGESAPLGVQVWESVLLHNPVCALVARRDQPTDVLARLVAGLVDAVRSHRPALVYLDVGDVELKRRRREIELEVIAGLDLPTLVVPVDGGRDELAEQVEQVEQAEQVRAFVGGHLGLDAHAKTWQVG
jgi:hypothetical protein